MQLILASQSPRRKELLGLFRLPFIVRVADADETMDPALMIMMIWFGILGLAGTLYLKRGGDSDS